MTLELQLGKEKRRLNKKDLLLFHFFQSINEGDKSFGSTICKLQEFHTYDKVT